MISKYRYTILFFSVIGCAVLLLSVQIPFAYYSGDNVFHVAKISAASDGEFFTDPITGCQTIYPPYFHIIWGKVAQLLGLNGFQVSRLIQAINFLGLFLSGFFLLKVILKNTEKASLATLAIGLLIYAPTGKYIFLQSPYNFSIPFILCGIALLLLFYQTDRMKYAVPAALVLGWGINIWWWNIIPVGGIMVGLLIVMLRENWRRIISSKFLITGFLFGLILCLNFWPLYKIREILPNYDYDMSKYSYAGKHTFLENITAWLGTFIFKGNRQFFKHLVPSVLGSSSMVVLLYGFIASIYFYLIVLPFNYIMIFLSAKSGLKSLRDKYSGVEIILMCGAVSAFLLSVFALYRTDQSVVRRIQFYAFLFMLPGFCRYVWRRFDPLVRWRRMTMAVTLLFSLAIIFTVIYRFEPNINNNLPDNRREVIQFINNIPNHAHTRIFMIEKDTQILAREVRFRSFILSGHPTYFRQDEKQADSVYDAYRMILSRTYQSLDRLEEFETRYAVIGKSSVNLSPVINQISENSSADGMIGYFRKVGTVVLENDDWMIFQLP